jgi:hypothetical protein
VKSAVLNVTTRGHRVVSAVVSFFIASTMFAAYSVGAQTAQFIVTAPSQLAGSYAAVTYDAPPSNVTSTTPIAQGNIFVYDGVDCSTHTLTKPIAGSGAGKVALLTGPYPTSCIYYDDIVRELQADGVIAVVFGFSRSDWRTYLIHVNPTGLSVPVLYMQVDEVSQSIRSAVLGGTTVAVSFVAVPGMQMNESATVVPAGGSTSVFAMPAFATPSTGATFDFSSVDLDRTISGLQQSFISSASSNCGAGVSFTYDPLTHLVTATVPAGDMFTGLCTKTFLIRDTAGFQGIGLLELYIGVPFARDDQAQIGSGGAVLIDVLANDVGDPSIKVAARIDLDPTTTAVDQTVTTAEGVWRVVGNNVEFTSAAGFVGVVSVGYVVRGANGGSSNSATITVDVGNPNYQGMWAVPNLAEAGWGINFTHQGDIIFASWFTYNLNGYPSWLTMTAQQQSDGSYTGTIDLTSGPPFNAVPFDPSRVTHGTLGTGRLTFSDANNGTFSYTVNGISQVKTLARFVFAAPVPVCTFNSTLAATQAVNYQDMWAVPNLVEAGWGINFTHQGDVIFASWFTYDLNGYAFWLTATLVKTAARTYAGPLDATSGPPFNSVPFDPSRVMHFALGTATVTFTDGANGAFAYTLNGVSQTKTITRFVFRAPGTVCQ